MADKKLVVTVTCCNVKKLDLKAYGVAKALCSVKVKLEGKEIHTDVLPGLDPTWEATYEFPVTDENTSKCCASFYMGEGETLKQIGDEQTYLLNVLTKDKPTFKAIIVPGGQVEMMFTARGFGKEDAPEEDDGLLDLLDGGDMVMDD
ncbi:hypothetical protein CEUSTIGMA_g8792.t1 [Chlamydomonas eustigma]|uniref:C2 domain-containing protein n=1 Tax=Chlamydomonas eustigma TaxID=1157962 RepID=A0A250XE83_9CHLO|nr:hypothetical protein CEUSTIGMA_g8792.t1 [Chlamydomonas eustigma]|eukprot:GAX81361.1 hypothetical protein CEUSTIGMA_g8792.t1 [Chlamydomonas eustigma]